MQLCPITVQFVVDFCKVQLGPYGLQQLHAFGSRVYGTARENSDHDFFAVVGDEAPEDILTGSALHMQIFERLERQRKAAGLGPIDLLIMRASSFARSSIKPGTFAFDATEKGVQVRL